MEDLKSSKLILEYPSVTMQIADLIGKPIEAGFNLLPKGWNNKIGGIVQAVLLKGLEFAIFTMANSNNAPPRNFLHKSMVTASGALGGFFGFTTVTVELPISTILILRSIADIAQSEGHDISLLEIRLSCLGVLALGGKSRKDDASENGYWAIRGALAGSIAEAGRYFAQRGTTDMVANKAAPPIARLLSVIAERFEVKVTEQFAAKAVPIVGALSGGAINLLFMQHFQDMAKAHFVIQRLEKVHGVKKIKEEYDKLVI
jgi:hypothetical protein